MQHNICLVVATVVVDDNVLMFALAASVGVMHVQGIMPGTSVKTIGRCIVQRAKMSISIYLKFIELAADAFEIVEQNVTRNISPPLPRRSNFKADFLYSRESANVERSAND